MPLFTRSETQRIHTRVTRNLSKSHMQQALSSSITTIRQTDRGSPLITHSSRVPACDYLIFNLSNPFQHNLLTLDLGLVMNARFLSSAKLSQQILNASNVQSGRQSVPLADSCLQAKGLNHTRRILRRSWGVSHTGYHHRRLWKISQVVCINSPLVHACTRA